MADDIYDLRPQLFYGGAWQDVPLHDDRSVSIVRGRVDAFAEPTHSATAVVADNRGGDYHPRNPTSPLYGVAGRNTPVRLVGDELVFEDFEDADSSLTVGPDYGGVAPWYRVMTDAHSGDWCWRSGEISAGYQTWADVEVPAGADSLEFWWRLSAGPTDSIVVWVDDGSDTWPLVWRVYGTGATTGWQRQSIDVSGQVWATIGYVRGEGAPAGEDCAYVDDVRFAQVRWAGEVAQWSPERTGDFDPATGRGDAWCGISGAGILRRLGQGTPPTQSAVRRALIAAAPTYYWPMEDNAGSTRIASGLVSGQPMTGLISSGQPVIGPVELGGDSSLPGSGPLPTTLPSVDWSLPLGLMGPSVLPADAWTMCYWMRIYDTGTADPAADYVSQTVQVQTVGAETLYWTVSVRYHQDTGIDDWGLVIPAGVAGAHVDLPHSQDWRFVRAVITSTGGFTRSRLYVDEVLVIDTLNDPLYSGTPTAVAIGATSEDPAKLAVSFGHLALWAGVVAPEDMLQAGAGWPAETAGARFLRLCAEDGVPATLVGDADDTVTMGPQWPDTFVNWLTEIERTDGGLLFEPRDQLGLAYRTRASLYAQEPKLILDWAQGQVAPPLQPTLDDQATRNDITVTRRNGSSARVTLDTGPMSILPPPDGVGRVETEIRVNPATDDMLPGLASWALHLGTVEDVRWPRVTVDLDACPELGAAASSVDIGDLIRIVNTPVDVSPDDIDLIVLGYTETIEPRRRRITFNCRPGSAWAVGRWDAFRWDSATSTLDTAVDATQTSLPVAVADGVWWTTDPAAWPFDVDVGGERMTVAAVSAPVAGVQTMAVTRSVNGVVKPHTAGTPVHVWDYGRWAL